VNIMLLTSAAQHLTLRTAKLLIDSCLQITEIKAGGRP
jgi:hypothetical protein